MKKPAVSERHASLASVKVDGLVGRFLKQRSIIGAVARGGRSKDRKWRGKGAGLIVIEICPLTVYTTIIPVDRLPSAYRGNRDLAVFPCPLFFLVSTSVHTFLKSPVYISLVELSSGTVQSKAKSRPISPSSAYTLFRRA